MDKQQANKMDNMMVGPRLFCQYCRKKKVLSPCYFCQYKGNDLNKRYCRGCGRNSCRKKREICRVFGKEKLLLKINEIAMKKGVENFHIDTPSCVDEKNNRIKCPQCSKPFQYSEDHDDLAEIKEIFADHYTKEHGNLVPAIHVKELRELR